MTIEVTAIVRPSPCLRRLRTAFAMALLAAAAWLALTGAPLAGPRLIAAALPPVMALAALAGLCPPILYGAHAKAHRIDISRVGQLRLAVYLHAEGGAGERVTLLGGALLWPWLLVLPLRRDDGGAALLVVLPDSVAPGEFRPLALACRACAEKNL
ncbi:hypothetical protein [Pseudoduganella namucuonensis]|uniref:Toxin CptA n=1 Tax=Pseudoduganella namucuonensis TaxID=1035707 RepID=A0A1I7LG66_9BURK|nr:hypothetical protein [Pseudoduganella namucuonensis]SFV08650.1 toxin CptA [Pseudoduganella namucuonensis]